MDGGIGDTLSRRRKQNTNDAAGTGAHVRRRGIRSVAIQRVVVPSRCTVQRRVQPHGWGRDRGPEPRERRGYLANANKCHLLHPLSFVRCLDRNGRVRQQNDPCRRQWLRKPPGHPPRSRQTRTGTSDAAHKALSASARWRQRPCYSFYPPAGANIEVALGEEGPTRNMVTNAE